MPGIGSEVHKRGNNMRESIIGRYESGERECKRDFSIKTSSKG